MDNIINIFTDGSTLNNQVPGNRIGGSGIFFGHNDKRNLSIPLKETKDFKLTNQVAELTACVKAIEYLIKSKTINNIITIYTDSNYIVLSMSRWCNKWNKNGFRLHKRLQIEMRLFIGSFYGIRYYILNDEELYFNRMKDKDLNKNDFIYSYLMKSKRDKSNLPNYLFKVKDNEVGKSNF